MKEVTGLSGGQIRKLIDLGFEKSVTPGGVGKNVLASGMLADLFDPAANLDPANRQLIRRALGLGHKAGKLDVDSVNIFVKPTTLVEMVEDRGFVVTDEAKDAFKLNPCNLQRCSYRPVLVRQSNLTGTNPGHSANSLDLMLPPQEVAFLMRARYMQFELGPAEIIIPAYPVLNLGPDRAGLYVLREGQNGCRDMLDVISYGKEGMSFRPDQYFIFVHPFGGFETLKAEPAD